MGLDNHLFKFSAEFVQDADDCSPDQDSYNVLNISTEDGGGGKFFVIETNRWAFDKVDDLLELVNRFNAMLDENDPGIVPE